MTDQRTFNKYPEGKSAAEFLKGYVALLGEALAKVPAHEIDAVFATLKKARQKRSTIYVAGNGGSAAISAHLCCDWMKGTKTPGLEPLKVHSLMENTPLLTALANDVSYEESIAEQVNMLGEAGDVLILISSSGNSPNILAAARAAHAKKMTVIGFSGFKGGKLVDASDISLYVPVDNYGVTEDAHQVLMHVLAQFLYLETTKQPAKSKSKPKKNELEIGL